MGAQMGSWKVALTHWSPASFYSSGSFSAFSLSSLQTPPPWSLSHSLEEALSETLGVQSQPGQLADKVVLSLKLTLTHL